MSSEVRQGDCLDVVRDLPAESVDLVYVDPPFFTQKIHSLVTRDRRTTFQFSDEWSSRAEYLQFVRLRLAELARGGAVVHWWLSFLVPSPARLRGERGPENDHHHRLHPIAGNIGVARFFGESFHQSRLHRSA